MEIYSKLASIFTVLSFFVFIGIVLWAYSARRKRSFDEAANEPFALPDDAGPRDGNARKPQSLTSYPTPAGRGERGESHRDSRPTGARR